jgi:hypothetical protein
MMSSRRNAGIQSPILPFPQKGEGDTELRLNVDMPVAQIRFRFLSAFICGFIEELN